MEFSTYKTTFRGDGGKAHQQLFNFERNAMDKKEIFNLKILLS